MTRRDAIWRDIQVLFTLCATSSRAVTWQQGIWDPEQIKLGNLNGCFDPTWLCVYLTDIPQKITSIRITQPHKHITWNTNSSHLLVLIKVCWGVNPGCVNSTSHVTLNQASWPGDDPKTEGVALATRLCAIIWVQEPIRATQSRAIASRHVASRIVWTVLLISLEPNHVT